MKGNFIFKSTFFDILFQIRSLVTLSINIHFVVMQRIHSCNGFQQNLYTLAINQSS